jgi:hypothetical protein
MLLPVKSWPVLFAWRRRDQIFLLDTPVVTESPCVRDTSSLHCAHLRAIVAREVSKGGVKTMRSVNADLVFAASCRAL